MAIYLLNFSGPMKKSIFCIFLFLLPIPLLLGQKTRSISIDVGKTEDMAGLCLDHLHSVKEAVTAALITGSLDTVSGYNLSPIVNPSTSSK